jgi:hypothetical protein
MGIIQMGVGAEDNEIVERAILEEHPHRAEVPRVLVGIPKAMHRPVITVPKRTRAKMTPRLILPVPMKMTTFL